VRSIKLSDREHVLQLFMAPGYVHFGKRISIIRKHIPIGFNAILGVITMSFPWARLFRIPGMV